MLQSIIGHVINPTYLMPSTTVLTKTMIMLSFCISCPQNEKPPICPSICTK